MVELVSQWIALHGYPVIFGLFALGIIGLPIPNELLLAYLGYLTFRGELQPVPTVAFAFLGSVCGMSFNYLLGRTIGCYLVRRFGAWFHLTGEKVARAHDWFEHRGRWGLLAGYFLPGIRHATAFAAGTTRMHFLEFSVFTAAGALLWTVLFIALGYLLEDQWSRLTEQIHHILEISSIGALAILSLYLFLVKRSKQQ